MILKVGDSFSLVLFMPYSPHSRPTLPLGHICSLVQDLALSRKLLVHRWPPVPAHCSDMSLLF